MPNIAIIGLRENCWDMLSNLIPNWNGKTVWDLRDAIVKLFEGKAYQGRINVTIYVPSYALKALVGELSSDAPFVWVTCSRKNPLGEIMDILHQSTYFRVRGNYIEKSLAPRVLPSG